MDNEIRKTKIEQLLSSTDELLSSADELFSSNEAFLRSLRTDLSKYGIEAYLNMYGVDRCYYMVHQDNLASILANGILSHNKARGLPHHDFSLDWMQDQREKIIPETGRQLHDYANLYFATHTPMQYILTHPNKWDHEIIEQKALVFIEADALKVFMTSGVVFTDGGAGRFRAKFYTNPADLRQLDWDIIRKRKGTSMEYKLRKSAEVLVPDVIPINVFRRIVVFSEEMRAVVNRLPHLPCPCHVDRTLYY